MKNMNKIYRENLLLKNQITTYKMLLDFSKETLKSNRDYKNLNYDIQEFVKEILKFDMASFYIYDEFSRKLLFENCVGFENSNIFLKTLDTDRSLIEKYRRMDQFEVNVVHLNIIPHFIKNIDFFNENLFFFTSLPIFLDNLFYGVYFFYGEKSYFSGNKVCEVRNPYYYEQISELVSDRIQTERAHYLSKYDSLTELFNRSYFEEEFSKYKKIALEKRESFCLALIDINKLKSINDNLGHLAGDFAIKKFSDALKTLINPENLVARYGGDEFIVVFGNSSYEECEKRMESFRKKFISREYIYENTLVPIRFSYGIACSPSESMILHILLKIADERMYSHKKILSEKEKQEFNF